MWRKGEENGHERIEMKKVLFMAAENLEGR